MRKSRPVIQDRENEYREPLNWKICQTKRGEALFDTRENGAHLNVFEDKTNTNVKL